MMSLDAGTTLGARAVGAHWWVPLLRGVVAIVFGVVAFAYPFAAVGAFVFVFAAYALFDGVLAIVQALRYAHPDSGRWWSLLLQGLAGIAIGVLAFLLPGLAAATFGLLIAIWAIVTGVLEIVAGLRLRRDAAGEIFLIVAGVLSLVAGILLLGFPLGATVVFVYVVAAYAIMAGIALVALSLRLRAWHERSGRPSAPAT
jgi:uncharacterized membrane protein HdeD (DUF308 family)